MIFWIHFIYWTHWGLDILFAVACLSVIFRPNVWARLYLTVFLVQQLILNGCIMSLLENKAEAAAGWGTTPNRFIMAEVLNGPVVMIYKFIFLFVAIWQLYYITKEVYQWTTKKNGKKGYTAKSSGYSA